MMRSDAELQAGFGLRKYIKRVYCGRMSFGNYRVGIKLNPQRLGVCVMLGGIQVALIPYSAWTESASVKAIEGLVFVALPLQSLHHFLAIDSFQAAEDEKHHTEAPVIVPDEVIDTETDPILHGAEEMETAQELQVEGLPNPTPPWLPPLPTVPSSPLSS